MVDSKKDVLLGAERLVDVLLRQHEVLIKVKDGETNNSSRPILLLPLPKPKQQKIPEEIIDKKDDVLDPSKHLMLLKLYAVYYEHVYKREFAMRINELTDADNQNYLVRQTLAQINQYVSEQNITDAQKDKCNQEFIKNDKISHPFRWP